MLASAQTSLAKGTVDCRFARRWLRKKPLGHGKGVQLLDGPLGVLQGELSQLLDLQAAQQGTSDGHAPWRSILLRCIRMQ